MAGTTIVGIRNPRKFINLLSLGDNIQIKQGAIHYRTVLRWELGTPYAPWGVHIPGED